MPKMITATEWAKRFYELTETRLPIECQPDRWFLQRTCAAMDALNALPLLPEPEWSRENLDPTFDLLFDASSFRFEENRLEVERLNPGAPTHQQKHVKRCCQSLHANLRRLRDAFNLSELKPARGRGRKVEAGIELLTPVDDDNFGNR